MSKSQRIPWHHKAVLWASWAEIVELPPRETDEESRRFYPHKPHRPKGRCER